MKYLIQTLLIFSLWDIGFAQSIENDNSRFIEVTGSSEATLKPDKIELEIILKEYSTQKLLSVHQNLIDILEKNNIDSTNLYYGNSNNYWYYWWSFRNTHYKQQLYKINLDASTDFLNLVKDLDINGVASIRISNTSNKEIEKIRKEVKISAIKAAKDKARYLLESIDEKLGKVISIEELPPNQNYYWRSNQNIISNTTVTTNTNTEDIENISTIKIRYEIKAKFEIE